MDAASEVKQRLSIDEVIGDYIELKRSGRNLKGLCPFHGEKTPSFMVNPEKGIYHCFGCGEGGDHFEFVMKMDGLSFRESLEKLAQKAGVDLSQYSGGSNEKTEQKKRLFDAHELAAKYYQQSLLQNQSAIDYITKKRHFNKHTISDFLVGYAPRTGTALRDFLRKRKFSDDELLKAGLVKQRNNQIVDAFFGRVLVALSDNQGRVIGFTGRVLDEGMPKYMNSQQTLLYDKSNHVFGLHQAKKFIREKNQAVIVEGNFDVLASHQVNVKNVVATAGTALTINQLKQLKRLTDNVAFAFDQDKAGVAATMRAIPIAQNAEINLSIITLPDGSDPDDLIQKDLRAWQKAAEEPIYVMDWLFAHLEKEHDLETGSGKTSYSNQLAPIITKLSDPIEQEHYMKLLADKTDVSLDAVKRKLQLSENKVKPKRVKESKYKVEDIDERKNTEESLIGLALLEPSIIETLKLTPNVFEGSRAEIIDSGKLPEHAEYVTILRFKAEELYGDWTQNQRLEEARALRTRLIEKSKQQTKQDLSSAIREAEQRGDQEAVQKLLEQYQSELR